MKRLEQIQLAVEAVESAADSRQGGDSAASAADDQSRPRLKNDLLRSGYPELSSSEYGRRYTQVSVGIFTAADNNIIIELSTALNTRLG